MTRWQQGYFFICPWLYCCWAEIPGVWGQSGTFSTTAFNIVNSTVHPSSAAWAPYLGASVQPRYCLPLSVSSAGVMGLDSICCFHCFLFFPLSCFPYLHFRACLVLWAWDKCRNENERSQPSI
jgi:hypothetical protein